MESGNVNISVKSTTSSWNHPADIMKLHNLKKRKSALQSRIRNKPNMITQSTVSSSKVDTKNVSQFDAVLIGERKRGNPFTMVNSEQKRSKISSSTDESSDDTLFKLFHLSSKSKLPDYSIKANPSATALSPEPLNERKSESWFPTDWSLKTKMRIWSKSPFPWNQNLRVCEEASGITDYVRCLSSYKSAQMNTSPNSTLHQHSLYWQHPSLPWLKLFPRAAFKDYDTANVSSLPIEFRSYLQSAWIDSFRSVFHLLKTKQCPFFYLCASSTTVLFRAAGLAGFDEINAIVTPTTSGFRRKLRQENVEYTMPLSSIPEIVDCSESSIDDVFRAEDTSSNLESEADEQWLKYMGVGPEDIKQINYSQDKIRQNNINQVDNSSESLILVQGVEVNGLYNCLLNCKALIATTGTFAGIPPTLLAPVAFNGATLNATRLKYSKAYMGNDTVYSLDITGAILPSNTCNIITMMPKDKCFTVSFSTFPTTKAFNNVKSTSTPTGDAAFIFQNENLADCGLNKRIREQFCLNDSRHVSTMDFLKCNENNTYLWK